MGWYSIEGGMGWYSLALFPPPQEVDQCDDGDVTDLQVQTSSRLDKLAPASGPRSGHRSHRSVCLNSPVTVVLYGSIPDRVCHMSCIDNLPPAHQLLVSKTEKKMRFYGVLKKTPLKLFDRFPPSKFLKIFQPSSGIAFNVNLKQLMNWCVTNMKNNLIMCMISQIHPYDVEN